MEDRALYKAMQFDQAKAASLVAAQSEVADAEYLALREKCSTVAGAHEFVNAWVEDPAWALAAFISITVNLGDDAGAGATALLGDMLAEAAYSVASRSDEFYEGA